MRLRVFTEPQQGASYAQLSRLAIRAEECGYDAFFRSDHYLRIGTRDGLPGPTDAWATLAALAVQTSTIRLGTLVTSATFRLPGPLAITVAQVDAMSGGRVEFGLGAGWFEREHRAYGIPFPALGERFDRLEEQLAIITGLWAAAEPFSFEGKHYQIEDSPGLPKPAQQPGPPVIIGGGGPRRTPELAARYADEFNFAFRPLDATRAQFGRVLRACEDTGRDESGRAPMILSVAQVLCCGRDDAEIARRADSIGRTVEELRENGLCGTPDEVIAKLATFAGAGAERAYLQVLDVDDLEHIELVAAEVMPHV